MLNAPKVDISIYKELINLFFNSKSFFFFVITEKLKKKTTNDFVISAECTLLITNLVNKLVTAENAYSELEKLSQCQAFDSFIDRFIAFISSLALNGSEEEKRKELIASVSQYFLEQLVIITRDLQAQQELASFLGSGSHCLPQNFHKSNIKSQTHLSLTPKRESNKTSSDFERLNENFNDELSKTLNNLHQVYVKESGVKSKLLFYWKKCFEHLKFVSMLYGFEYIEAISDRMIRVATIYSKEKKTKLAGLKDLYEYAIEAIQRIVANSTHKEEFLHVLRTMDHFIETGELNEIHTNNNDSDLIANDFDDILPKENNPSQYIDNVDDNNGNQIDFKIPGEDDPELLALIKEISGVSSQSENNRTGDRTQQIREIKEEGFVDKANRVLKEKPITLDNESDLPIDSNIKIFIEEAALFFKLIKSALIALNEDPEDESGLEDLELASYSLKSEALKLGFEKLSKIPELIEDIAKYAIAHHLHLPNHMLNTISKAIVLLQSVKKDQKEEVKFRQIQKELHNYFLNLKKRFRTNQ